MPPTPGAMPDGVCDHVDTANAAERTEVELPAELLAEYAGAYPIATNFTLTMTVVDGALVSRATGQPDVPLYAEAKDRFFAKVIDAQIEFMRGGDGKVNGLILRQGPNQASAPKE